jgi:hypothetical protein
MFGITSRNFLNLRTNEAAYNKQRAAFRFSNAERMAEGGALSPKIEATSGIR